MERNSYSPDFVQLIVTRRCNLACSYCNEFDNSSKGIDKEVLKQRIDQIFRLETENISFLGGEPLLHKDIAELVAYAREKFKRVMITTNGFPLRIGLIKLLNAAELSDIEVSIDGMEPDSDTQKVLSLIRKKLSLLKDLAKFDVNVNVTYGVKPFKEVEAMVREITDLGFSTTFSLLHNEHGQMALKNGSLEEYQRLLALRHAPVWGQIPLEMPLLRDGRDPFNCRAGSKYLYVDEDGYVNWCSQTRNLFRKQLEEYTVSDLEEQYHTPKDCNEGCTLNCVRAVSK